MRRARPAVRRRQGRYFDRPQGAVSGRDGTAFAGLYRQDRRFHRPGFRYSRARREYQPARDGLDDGPVPHHQPGRGTCGDHRQAGGNGRLRRSYHGDRRRRLSYASNDDEALGARRRRYHRGRARLRQCRPAVRASMRGCRLYGRGGQRFRRRDLRRQRSGYRCRGRGQAVERLGYRRRRRADVQRRSDCPRGGRAGAGRPGKRDQRRQRRQRAGRRDRRDRQRTRGQRGRCHAR